MSWYFWVFGILVSLLLILIVAHLIRIMYDLQDVITMLDGFQRRQEFDMQDIKRMLGSFPLKSRNKS